MNLGNQLLLFILIAISVNTPLFAEIYKYKDENGKWQFSDEPPTKKSAKIEIINTDSDSNGRGNINGSDIELNAQSEQPKNLAKSLEAAFTSSTKKTPVEKTTLAVVSIKNALGGGTGFFVSNDGYIVTNRHVVRPTTTAQWEKSNEKFLENLAEVDTQKRNIDRRQKELTAMSKQLEQYRKHLENSSEGTGGSRDTKSIGRSEYNIYKNRYKDLKKGLKKTIKIYEENKKIIEKQKSDFNFASTLSRTVRHFKIQLKDNSILHAELVSLSKQHDLALLKLSGHITPFIDINNAVTPPQGSKVYAIGSPLGLRDFVTYGIVTNVRKNQIVTDTQILPGNSGGPLIDTNGRIIGVNTLKLMADDSIGSAGFGVAIPISIVNAEFGEAISH